MRKTYSLSVAELSRFNRLKPLQGEAWTFWKQIARDRNLDPKSLITTGQMFSGLPIDHLYHWCFPSALICKKKVAYTEV